MSVHAIFDTLYYVFFAFILIPLWIGFREWSSLTLADKWIVALLTSLSLLEIVSDILTFNRIRNHFLYYGQTVIVLWLGSYFYVQVRKWRRWPLRIAFLISVLVPVEVIGWVGFNHINSVTLTLSRLVLAGYAFSSLRQLIDDHSGPSLRSNPLVYQHLGFLVYGFFSAVTMYFRNYFIETSLDLYFFFDILGVMMGAVAFGFFAVGFSCRLQGLSGLQERI